MQLGTVEGEVDTSSFTFRATEEVKKFDFVSVKSNGEWILAQVEEVTKEPGGETLADASIIGYREKGLTKAPRRVIEPDSIVYEADQELITDTLGLRDAGLNIGNLETNPDIDIFVDSDELYKHFAVLAQTGAGKSYLSSVLIEELLEEDFPVIIVDPHGEYSSLAERNPQSEDPRGYDVREFSPNTDVNSGAEKLGFSPENLEKKELIELVPDSLTNSQMGVLYNALKELREKDDPYDLDELMDAVSRQDSTARWNLLNSLEQLQRSGLFSEDSVELEELVEPGRATVVNLRAVEPETAEMAVYLLAERLFDMRKRALVPPFFMVMEEAHNFVPEKGFEQAVSNGILRKIASEGRKFGLGIGVISQRPARIDKNVLSQCNTQFILRVTNPNDLSAISKSFEGVTSEVESMITSLPPGVAFVLGGEYPVMAEVRTRRSEHGGETETAEDYEERRKLSVFPPSEDLDAVEEELGESLEVAYYPLYMLEDEDSVGLVDGRDGSVKAEREKLSEKEREVWERMQEDGKLEPDELGVSVSELASLREQLREKGYMQDGEPSESLLDLETEEKRVESGKIIEPELDPGGAGGGEKKSVEKVFYPYYSSGETVYDPVLGERL